jgi:hypothetical protein
MIKQDKALFAVFVVLLLLAMATILFPELLQNLW